MLPKWNGAYFESVVGHMANSDYKSNEDGITTDSSNPDCCWLEEDRLEDTPLVNGSDRQVRESTLRSSHGAAVDMATFHTVCDFLSMDSSDTRLPYFEDYKKHQREAPPPRDNDTVVTHRVAWPNECPMGDVSVLPIQAPPMPPTASLELMSRKPMEKSSYDSSSMLDVSLDALAPSTFHGDMDRAKYSNANYSIGARTQAINSGGARAQADNSNANNSSGARAAQANNSNATNNSIETRNTQPVKYGKAKRSSSGIAQIKNSSANNGTIQDDIPMSSQAVASDRSIADIEAAVERTRNNSNQQQRYEMRGGHAVEICSQVDFPDQATRVVSVTVEATHSNGCHRVVMLKGLTATKRPDLGPKVKDCRLRMDQIVLTRPSVTTNDWQKNITMSYDSDFQVGLNDDNNQPL